MNTAININAGIAALVLIPLYQLPGVYKIFTNLFLPCSPKLAHRLLYAVIPGLIVLHDVVRGANCTVIFQLQGSPWFLIHLPNAF